MGMQLHACTGSITSPNLHLSTDGTSNRSRQGRTDEGDGVGALVGRVQRAAQGVEHVQRRAAAVAAVGQQAEGGAAVRQLEQPQPAARGGVGADRRQPVEEVVRAVAAGFDRAERRQQPADKAPGSEKKTQRVEEYRRAVPHHRAVPVTMHLRQT